MELPPLSGLISRHAPIPGKTTIACDTCRQRKSRCDGIRPRCSHCASAGIVCNYRPTPTSLETDESVLSRLADVEARLDALRDVESRLQVLESSGASDAGVNHRRERKRPRMSSHSDADWPDHGHSRSAVPDRLRPPVAETSPNQLRDEARKPRLRFQPPLLHSASACQMLHSWPRLRFCLGDDVDPLRLLKKTDRQESLFDERLEIPQGRLRINWESVVDELDFDKKIYLIPAAIRYLFKEGLRMDKPAMIAAVLDKRNEESTMEDIESLGMRLWVVFSMAIPKYTQPALAETVGYLPDEMESQARAINLAGKICLRLALDRYANTQYDTLSERVALPLALAYSLVYFWGRPFQALEVLQSIETKLHRWSVRRPDDPHLIACCKLYMLLEGDLLTEIDEFCSDTILFEKSTAFRVLRERPECLAHDEQQSDLDEVINNLVKSRNHMDGVLDLYTPSRAYARPSDLRGSVERLWNSLNTWHQDLSVLDQFNWPFPKMKEETFSMDSLRRETGFRFFASRFLIHRPILAYFLHKDLEYNLHPADQSSNSLNDFTLDSCQECVRSAITLICIGLPTHSQVAWSWCNYQLLFAAYMVVLQVQDLPTFESVFKVLGEPARHLLDYVETKFTQSEHRPLIRTTLRTMKLLRQRFPKSRLQRLPESA